MGQEALREFEQTVEAWDRQYLNLFELRIIKAEHKIEMGKTELKHWQEMKEIFLSVSHIKVITEPADKIKK